MKKIFSFFIVLLLTTNFIFSQDSESDGTDLSFHSIEDKIVKYFFTNFNNIITII